MAASTTAELREEAAAELGEGAAAGASGAASTTAELGEEAAAGASGAAGSAEELGESPAELGEGLSCRDRVTIHENKDKDMVYKRLAKGNFEKVTAAEKTWLRKH